MKIAEEIIGDVVILHLNGKILVAEDATILRGALYKYVESGKRKTVLDFAKVNRIGSLGIGALAAAKTTMINCDGVIKLANLTEKIKELLIIVRLIKLFEIYDSVEEAVDSFKR